MSILIKERGRARWWASEGRTVAIVGVLIVLASWFLIAQAAQSPTLKASLVDAAKKATAHTATVEVSVDGVSLIDPDTTTGQTKEGEGHLHYQLDSGPVIATTAPKLSFHGLSSGQHTLLVVLAGNDHASLGPQEVLEFAIP